MKRNLSRLTLAFFLLLILASVVVDASSAQVRGDWSPPVRLSSNNGDASEAFLVADDYGFVHVFWTEDRDNDRTVIQYARYNGVTWSTTVDIYTSRPFNTIGNVSPVIDADGVLHIAWSEGLNGILYYAKAPFRDAMSAQKWSKPRRIGNSADVVRLRIDDQGIYHILYSKSTGSEKGIYYIQSSDQGENWSAPEWLDPDIPPNQFPAWPQFEIDEAGGLHAVWHYLATDLSDGGWVRYIHSLDGGSTWSQPFTIDSIGEHETNKQLDAANAVMTVLGESVHIIWAGGRFHYRNYRYSEDAGQTWSEPRRLFGELNGQAGDGMAVDGAGRIHFFSQIRFPQGIYHAVWEDGQWSQPSLVYLVSYGEGDLIGDRIHAHRTFPAVRAGNQLLLTFTDPPPTDGRRLFATQLTLEDIPPETLRPTPTASPVLQAEGTPVPQATAESQPIRLGAQPPASMSRPDSALWIGLLIPALIVGAIVLIRLINKYRYSR